MPTLNWMDKEKVTDHHRDVPFRVLERVPEKDVLDGLELTMVDLLANSRRVVCGHRVVERKLGEFCINGFINHYPDFLALRDDGVLMAIETKGEYLAGNARRKLRPGTRWADMAGN